MTSKDPLAPAAGATPEKQALLEAFDDVLRTESERRDETPPPARRERMISPVAAIGLITILVTLAAVFVTRPAWLGFPDAYVETPVVQDASLRLAMYQARQRVEQYRLTRGSLPATLAEAGVTDPALRITVITGSRYVIEGASDTVRLALRSDEPVRPFLGDAFEVVAGGRGQ